MSPMTPLALLRRVGQEGKAEEEEEEEEEKKEGTRKKITRSRSSLAIKEM